MKLHWVDAAIVVAYLLAIVVSGIILSKRAARGIDSYFLGGRNIPWYLLSISNASGQFDIAGTMLMVAWMFVYGVKSCWIPWLWPTFNQIFLMVFLAAWLRRSGALTGAEWLRTRFSKGGLELSRAAVVLFALVSVVGFLAYAYEGIGKFAVIFLPTEFSFLPWEVSADQYAMLLMSVTTAYVVLGGMYSVVLTDVIQFVLLTVASLFVAGIALANTSGEVIAAATPNGWGDLGFGWRSGLDWSELIGGLQTKIATDGYDLFAIFVMMAFFKGILNSIAGPAPNYDMQRVLATRSPRESALMSGLVSPILYVPRYLLIAGITVLGIVHFSDVFRPQNEPDIEQLLPLVVDGFIPVVLKGVLLAGLLAAFMSTFDSTVNAGAAYLVNDVYKRYLRPAGSSRHYVIASYVGSLLVVAVGIAFGRHVKSIDDALQWITAGLYGGYVAPNLLKWIWWRLNGIGYFTGMIVGLLLAMPTANMDLVYGWFTKTAPSLADDKWLLHSAVTPLNLFPFIFAASALACVIASLLSRPEPDDVLMKFYRQVRPWGFWKPIHEKVTVADPTFEIQSGFRRDMVNCAIGIVWQIALTTAPVFLIIRQYESFWVATVVVIVMSIALKWNWYDKLEGATEERKNGGIE